MLKSLSGSTHEVISGFAVVAAEGFNSGFCITKVKFRDLSDDEIRAYIRTGEPMDKAGAYGIQGLGGRFVVGFCGNYDTVVGLSVSLTSRLIEEVKDD